jgi:hypothetical protein
VVRSALGATVLLGAHYFGRPEPAGGAVFTCALSDAQAESALSRRFDELWDRGYDVLEVVQAAIRVGLGESAVP